VCAVASTLRALQHTVGAAISPFFFMCSRLLMSRLLRFRPLQQDQLCAGTAHCCSCVLRAGRSCSVGGACRGRLHAHLALLVVLQQVFGSGAARVLAAGRTAGEDVLPQLRSSRGTGSGAHCERPRCGRKKRRVPCGRKHLQLCYHAARSAVRHKPASQTCTASVAGTLLQRPCIWRSAARKAATVAASERRRVAPVLSCNHMHISTSAAAAERVLNQ
jgi:hypothetical protein